MKVLLFLIGLVSLTVAHTPFPSHCVFELGNNTLNYPLLLEKVEGRYKFLPVPSHGQLKLHSNQQVVATCQSQSFGFCTDKFGSVQLQCKRGQPFVSFRGKVVPYCPGKYVLSCKGPVVQHYPYPVEGCDKFGLVAAYVNHVRTTEPENNLVKLAGFCYDTVNQKVLFADFKSYHSVFLDEQYVWNVESHLAVDAKVLQGVLQPVDYYNFGPRQPNLGQGNQWVAGNLVPQPLVRSQYHKVLSSSRLNQVTVWQALANRNWNNFLNVLKELTEENVLDLFSGTSNGPRNVRPNPNAPTYVWLAVRAPKNNNFVNTVVVGVNVNGLNSQTVRPYLFGRDVFNQVPWLSSLNPGRLNPSSGYLFALSFEEAQRLLPEFPRVDSTDFSTVRQTTRRRTRTVLVTRRRTTQTVEETTTRRTVLVTRTRSTRRTRTVLVTRRRTTRRTRTVLVTRTRSTRRTRTVLVTRTRSSTAGGGCSNSVAVTRSSTRIVAVTRTRTTFGPFPCRKVKPQPNAPVVLNSQDLVQNDNDVPNAVDPTQLDELPAADEDLEELDDLAETGQQLENHQGHHHGNHGNLWHHEHHGSGSSQSSYEGESTSAELQSHWGTGCKSKHFD